MSQWGMWRENGFCGSENKPYANKFGVTHWKTFPDELLQETLSVDSKQALSTVLPNQ